VSELDDCTKLLLDGNEEGTKSDPVTGNGDAEEAGGISNPARLADVTRVVMGITGPRGRGIVVSAGSAVEVGVGTMG
jgi:hypothetical protein